MQNGYYLEGFYKDGSFDEKAEIEKVIRFDDFEQAKTFHQTLAHGYRHDGIGGGVSMDDIVLAGRDLLPMGFDTGICLQVFMESVEERFNTIMTTPSHSTHSLLPALLRTRSATLLSLASECPCDSKEG